MSSEFDRAVDFLEDISHAVDYAIVGPRDNRIQEFGTGRFPFNTICHIERDFGDGIWRGASGFLISPRTVLTAGHCLYNHRLRRAPARIRVSPGRSGRDIFPYRSVIASDYYVPRRYVEGPAAAGPAYRDYDYGIIALPRPFQGINRFMEVRTIPDQEFEDLRHERLVTIAGYPADKALGTMWRHTERLTRVTHRRLYYTIDTCPGHSGSPVWYKEGDRRYVIGVHTSGPIDQAGRAYGCSPGALFAPPGMVNSGIRITPEVRSAISASAGRGAASGLMRFSSQVRQ